MLAKVTDRRHRDKLTMAAIRRPEATGRNTQIVDHILSDVVIYFRDILPRQFKRLGLSGVECVTKYQRGKIWPELPVRSIYSYETVCLPRHFLTGKPVDEKTSATLMPEHKISRPLIIAPSRTAPRIRANRHRTNHTGMALR